MRAGLAALVKPAVVVSAGAAEPSAGGSCRRPRHRPLPRPSAQHQAVTPIQHFIFLMQGDRTFDNYFGTYPGPTASRPAPASSGSLASRPMAA